MKNNNSAIAAGTRFNYFYRSIRAPAVGDDDLSYRMLRLRRETFQNALNVLFLVQTRNDHDRGRRQVRKLI